MSNIKKSKHNPNIEQRLATNPDVSVWVSASAGTGKTKVLTDRVLRLLLSGTKPSKILCLTFTKAAASEMALRISDQLGNWTMAGDDHLEKNLTQLLGQPPTRKIIQKSRQLFLEVLDSPSGINIQTIHAFCQSLLARFPIEAGITPHFSLMDERDTEEMLIASRENLLNESREYTNNILGSALAEITKHIHENQFLELLTEIARNKDQFIRLINRNETIDNIIKDLNKMLSVETNSTPDEIIENSWEMDIKLINDLEFAAEALSQGSETDKKNGKIIDSWIKDKAPTNEKFYLYINVFLTSSYKKKNIEIRKRLLTKKVSEDSPFVSKILEREAERLVSVLLNWRSVSIAKSTAAILTIGLSLIKNYQMQKELKALLDYDDLIQLAGKLLNERGIAPWILFKLDGGIDHILIDEAQDTSPDQWRVIEALADEFFSGLGAHETNPTIFIVGDAKQSIYSFQGADPNTFNNMRDLFSERTKASQQKLLPIDLNTSFRSTTAILSVVDSVFNNTEAFDGVRAKDNVIHHDASRDKDAGLVELWPPVEPKASDPPNAWKPPVERILGDMPQTRLAQLIASRISTMIINNEMLESKGRPIEAGDIMVLVRRRNKFVIDLVKALKELNVDVTGVDRMTLNQQLAIMDLIALGRFLLLPSDDLNLANALKSPLFGISEEKLYKISYERSGSLWESLEINKSDAELKPIYNELSSLLAIADFTPPFELFTKILNNFRGRNKLLKRLGPDILDPISEFISLTLSYEKSHVASLEGFIYWFLSGNVDIKRDLEQQKNTAVRVLTVHGAKGLQSPIVFLPDTLQVPTKSPKLFWPRDKKSQNPMILWPPRRSLYETIAEEELKAFNRSRLQEYNRLLYVAMTRAEDRLYICGWKTQKKETEGNWYDLIKKGLEPIGEKVEDSFLRNAKETETSEILRFVSPQIRKIPEFRQSLKIKNPKLPSWALEKLKVDQPIKQNLAPSRGKIKTPDSILVENQDSDLHLRMGDITHKLLQFLPDISKTNYNKTIINFLSQTSLGLNQKQQERILKEVLQLLQNQDLNDIFGPNSMAEVPLIGSIGGQTFSGQVDRLIISDNKILIIDFKTNQNPPINLREIDETYLRQIGMYQSALKSIYPNKIVECGLLWTVGPKLMMLKEEMLMGFSLH